MMYPGNARFIHIAAKAKGLDTYPDTHVGLKCETLAFR